MRLQLVINPAAGGGRAMHALPKVEAALSATTSAGRSAFPATRWQPVRS
ncbi:MAG TPA: hypothetical protein VIM01_02180 [Dermatophilaceae bacterium]